MDKAVVVRRSVKHLFGLAAVLGCGFILLNAARPDVAARLTGSQYDKANQNNRSFFARLFNGGSQQHSSSGRRYSASSQQKEQQSAIPAPQKSGNGGKLRKKYGQLAFNNGMPGSSYVPFEFATTAAPDQDRVKHRVMTATPVQKPDEAQKSRNRRSTRHNINRSAPKSESAQKGFQTVTTAHKQVETAKRLQETARARVANELSKRGHKVLSKFADKNISDDALVADALLTKANSDIRLAPAAIAAVEHFLSLHPGSKEAAALKTRLAEFRARFGRQLALRSTLGVKSKLKAVAIKDETLAQIRSCVSDAGGVTLLAIVQKTTVPGLPAYFIGVKTTIVSGNGLIPKLSRCLTSFFATGTVAIVDGRFGAKGDAVARIAATKNSKVYWTGFAGLSSVVRSR